MEQSGEYRVAASREVVWLALNDPEVLGNCIPGCVSIERTDEQTFAAKVKAKIGPVSATFDANLELQNIVPQESYTITGNVKGGAAGFGKGEAHVSLVAVEDETDLIYQVKGSVGGKLAQIGSRLVDGAARKMADDFFGAFRDHLSPDQDANEPSPEAGSAPVKYEEDGNKMVWGIAFVVLALAMLLAI